MLGEPESLSSAKQLAQDDRYQFQWWALSLIQAQPIGGQAGSKKGKKGKDQGIDGVITFIDEATAKPKRLIVQVKSGKVKSGDIRDLVGTIEREKASIGVFITLESPTKDMKSEAASAGFYHSPNWNKDYPRIQVLTIEELLSGVEVRGCPQRQPRTKKRRENGNKGSSNNCCKEGRSFFLTKFLHNHTGSMVAGGEARANKRLVLTMPAHCSFYIIARHKGLVVTLASFCRSGRWHGRTSEALGASLG